MTKMAGRLWPTRSGRLACGLRLFNTRAFTGRTRSGQVQFALMYHCILLQVLLRRGGGVLRLQQPPLVVGRRRGRDGGAEDSQRQLRTRRGWKAAGGCRRRLDRVSWRWAVAVLFHLVQWHCKEMIAIGLVVFLHQPSSLFEHQHQFSRLPRLAQSISFSALRLIGMVFKTCRAEGPPPKRRERLPTPKQKEKSVSLWAILKEVVGKDLTKVCSPGYQPSQAVSEHINFGTFASACGPSQEGRPKGAHQSGPAAKSPAACPASAPAPCAEN